MTDHPTAQSRGNRSDGLYMHSPLLDLMNRSTPHLFAATLTRLFRHSVETNDLKGMITSSIAMDGLARKIKEGPPGVQSDSLDQFSNLTQDAKRLMAPNRADASAERSALAEKMGPLTFDLISSAVERNEIDNVVVRALKTAKTASKPRSNRSGMSM